MEKKVKRSITKNNYEEFWAIGYFALTVDRHGDEDIDHTKTKVKRPQTNGICERFHRTYLR